MRVLRAALRACLTGRSNGPKGMCGSHMHACGAPAFPAARITAVQAMALWKRHFEDRGVTEPVSSVQHITAHVLGAKTMESLEQQKLTELLSQETTEEIWKLCTRRLSRMPVQYVIEEWDFRDLTLKMRPPVFIPRPETEELVSLVLADLQAHGAADGPHTCLEVGCGSGAISLSLLKSLPQLEAVVLDQSEAAVALTWENACRLGLQGRLQVHQKDVMQDSILGLCSRVSALVSNPPYVFSADMETLAPEILRFEDHTALDGGEDGLDVVKRILALAPQILSDHGRVYLEVEPRHPPLIQRWVEANMEELQYVGTHHDMASRPRFCILQKEKSNKDHERDPY